MIGTAVVLSRICVPGRVAGLEAYLTGDLEDQFNKFAILPRIVISKVDEAVQARSPATEFLGVADGRTEVITQKPSLACRQFLFSLQLSPCVSQKPGYRQGYKWRCSSSTKPLTSSAVVDGGRRSRAHSVCAVMAMQCWTDQQRISNHLSYWKF
jgi:hypothetical protein